MRIKLSDVAERAVRTLAVRERRDARRQCEYLIEVALAQRGLIESPGSPK